MRKTIELSFVIEKANFFLANSPDEQRAERLAIANFAEVMLHKAGAYKGYRHLGQNDPNSAGIPWHLQGQPFSYINWRDQYGNPVDARVRVMPADDNDAFARFIAFAISDGGWRNHLGQHYPIDATRRAYFYG